MGSMGSGVDVSPCRLNETGVYRTYTLPNPGALRTVQDGQDCLFLRETVSARRDNRGARIFHVAAQVYANVTGEDVLSMHLYDGGSSSLAA